MASAIWEDIIVDKEIDALVQAIFTEGGLGAVAWMEDGLNNIELEENIVEELAEKGNKVQEDNGEDDDMKISLKRKREVNTLSVKKKKTGDSKALVSSIETLEALQLRIEQQTEKYEVFETQLEAMRKQLQTIELMRLRVELLEKEMLLLSERLKTKEVS